MNRKMKLVCCVLLVIGATLWLNTPLQTFAQTAKQGEAPITTNHNASAPKDEVASNKIKKLPCSIQVNIHSAAQPSI